MKDFLEVMEESTRLDAAASAGNNRIERFEEKLANFIELIANKKGHRKHVRTYLMKEAETTSDFPNLFGTVLERTLLAKYKIISPDWRTYVKVGRQNDFRSAYLLATYGLQSAMSEVKQRGEYKGDSVGDGKFTIAVKKYGRRFDLAWETIINDDLGAFSDLSGDLARAAAATEQIQAVKAFVSTSGPNTTLFGTSFAHPIDGKTMTNKGTLTFNADNLFSTITALRNQKDKNNNPISITRFHLVVPPELEKAALQALSTSALIAIGVTNSSAVQTSENVTAKLPITLHINEYLTSVDTTHGTTTWYVFADPTQDGAACQLNFLAGHESPEIVQKTSDKVALGGGLVSPMEGNFANDSIGWRVRHILGTTQLDPRFAYAQAATS